eukprot:366524-Chlamydomonas_euryale.AAC.7
MHWAIQTRWEKDRGDKAYTGAATLCRREHNARPCGLLHTEFGSHFRPHRQVLLIHPPATGTPRLSHNTARPAPRPQFDA